MLVANTRYEGTGLVPKHEPESAKTMSVWIAPGTTILKGTVLGLVTNTGAAVNEVQTLSKTGTVTGGAFTLTAPDGQVTVPIAATATAATIQTALETIFGAGNVTATGGPVSTTDVVITFLNMCGGLAMPLLTYTVTTTLTGTDPVIAIAETTAGKPAGGYWVAYDAAGTDDGRRTARALMQYTVTADNFGKIGFGSQQGGGDYGVKDYTCPAFFAGQFATADLVGIDATAVGHLGRLLSGTTGMLTNALTTLRMV